MCPVNQRHDVRQNAAKRDDFVRDCFYLSKTGIVNPTAHRAGILLANIANASCGFNFESVHFANLRQRIR